jgi:hypothetical protein
MNRTRTFLVVFHVQLKDGEYRSVRTFIDADMQDLTPAAAIRFEQMYLDAHKDEAERVQIFNIVELEGPTPVDVSKSGQKDVN